MIEIIFIAFSVLLFVSVTSSKISDRFGIPSLLLFLIIGMLAGSEGIGGIYFDQMEIAQAIGFFALVVILFSGGLDTNWEKIIPVTKESLTLATMGVLFTAVIMGFFSHLLLDISFLEGLLIGSIISSTDAAAVFALLRSQGMKLKDRISATLELESGSNDPMAVFLTVGIISLLQKPDQSLVELLLFFLQQLLIGAGMGWAAARIALWLINRIRLGYEGLNSVMVLSILIFTFAITNLLNGSGVLAVYFMGLLMGNSNFKNKPHIEHFFEGLAWLMQVVMFLTLGLLVFPSQLIPNSLHALALSFLLMLIARPISVFVCTLPYQFSLKEKAFISWVGLRGAVPIILAMYPKIAGLPQGDMIFNIIFFSVLTSVLIQGTSIPIAAKKFEVEEESTKGTD